MVKLFFDSADGAEMFAMYQNKQIKGFTTNPSLLLKSGVTDYKTFAHNILAVIKDKPVSFEVFADDFDGMWDQAQTIDSWGYNVYVKIPIVNTQGALNYHIISELTLAGIKVNVTAIMTVKQVADILPALKNTPGAYLSVFAGRVADTGISPTYIIRTALKLIKSSKIKNIELIWASPREVLNVVEANEIGCDIITCSSEIIKKLPLLGKDLTKYSCETVQQFIRDGKGLKI